MPSHKYDGTALRTSRGELCSDAFHCKGPVPFLQEYMRFLRQTPMSITPTVDLFERYKDYVGKKTDDHQSLDALSTVTIVRFQKQFSNIALHWGWRKARIAGQRGYCVGLCRVQRLQHPTGQTTAAAVQVYLQISHEAMVWERLWRKVYLNKVTIVCFLSGMTRCMYCDSLNNLITEMLCLSVS